MCLRHAKGLDAKIGEFFSQPVDPNIPYLFVDAFYFEIDNGLRYSNKALRVIAGIHDGWIHEIMVQRLQVMRMS